jgi:hypothetical protein
MKQLACLLCFLAACGTCCAAQSASSPTPSPATEQAAQTPPARPGDVDTIEHILAAVYEVISGPPGPRDWDRFRALFYPGARLIPSRRDAAGKVSAASLTADDYARRGTDYFTKEGFFENSVANRVEVWDHIAHVWSSYESRHAKGEAPFARGVNSFQLIHDGTRWWVLTIYWEGEDKEHPLPEKYLK